MFFVVAMAVLVLAGALKSFLQQSGKPALEAFELGAYKGLAAMPTKAANGDALCSLASLLMCLFAVYPSACCNQVPLKIAFANVLLAAKATTTMSIDLLSTQLAAGLRVAAAHLRRIKLNATKWQQAIRWLSPEQRALLRKVAEAARDVPWFEGGCVDSAEPSVAAEFAALAPPASWTGVGEQGPVPLPLPVAATAVPPELAAAAGGEAAASSGDGSDPFGSNWDPTVFSAAAAKTGGLSDIAGKRRAEAAVVTPAKKVRKEVTKVPQPAPGPEVHGEADKAPPADIMQEDELVGDQIVQANVPVIDLEADTDKPDTPVHELLRN